MGGVGGWGGGGGGWAGGVVIVGIYCSCRLEVQYYYMCLKCIAGVWVQIHVSEE